MNEKPIDRQDDGTCDRSGEALLHDCCRELGVNMAMALQIVAWADENFSRTRRADCEADGDELRRLNSLQGKAWKFLIEYQANQKAPDEIRMSTRVMALECGFKLAAVGLRESTVAELARICHMDKQAVNKCALNFQKLMALARREGQRDETARAKMTEARIKQIKPGNEKS